MMSVDDKRTFTVLKVISKGKRQLAIENTEKNADVCQTNIAQNKIEINFRSYI